MELLELSGEHPTLPTMEALSLLGPVKHRQCGRYLIGEFYHIERIRKAAMCHRVNRVIAITDEDGIFQEIEDLDLKGTFMVRWKGRRDLEKRIGAILARKARVNLESPDHEIRILDGSGEIYLCEKLFDVDRGSFEKRKPKFRLYSPPISMHPRLARCMVNLAGNGGGKIMLDPFCGSGGILIEAALIGWRTAGSDVDPRSIAGCRKNLRQLDLEADLYLSDISSLDPGRVDAIVTDPPYGRSSLTGGKNTDELYRALLNMAEDHAEKLVATFPHPIGIQNGELISTVPIRVHRSLTRYLHIISFRGKR